MAGRKKAVLNNPYKDELLEVYLNQEMPYWLDDVIVGASRSQGSTELSPNMLLALLTAYDSITTDEIGTFLNRKREALEGRTITSQSYLREVRKALTCAVDAIAYQLEQGKTWNDQEYIRGSIEAMMSQFDSYSDERG